MKLTRTMRLLRSLRHCFIKKKKTWIPWIRHTLSVQLWIKLLLKISQQRNRIVSKVIFSYRDCSLTLHTPEAIPDST